MTVGYMAAIFVLIASPIWASELKPRSDVENKKGAAAHVEDVMGACTYLLAKNGVLRRKCEPRVAQVERNAALVRLLNYPILGSDDSTTLILKMTKSRSSQSLVHRYKKIADTCERTPSCAFDVADMGPFAMGMGGCLGDITFADTYFTLTVGSLVLETSLSGRVAICQDIKGIHILYDRENMPGFDKKANDPIILNVIDYFFIKNI